MIYVLRNKEIMRRCVQYISTLGNEPPFVVEVKPFKAKRSDAQNKYYWGVVLKIFGDFMGETPDDLHAYFRHRLLNAKDKVICGELIPGSASTTKLTTKEFSEYVDMIRATAAQMGCHIPDPTEFGLNGAAERTSLAPPDSQRIPALSQEKA